jgi:hypothetical protein
MSGGLPPKVILAGLNYQFNVLAHRKLSYEN